MQPAQAVPLRRHVLEVGGGGLGAAHAHLLEPPEIPRELAVARGQQVHEGASEGRALAGLVDAVEHRDAFAVTLQQPRLDQELQVARDARLALPEDLDELRDAELRVSAEREQPQPGRLPGGAQSREQSLHLHKDMFMS